MDSRKNEILKRLVRSETLRIRGTKVVGHFGPIAEYRTHAAARKALAEGHATLRRTTR